MMLNHKELQNDEWLSLLLSTPTLAGLCISIVAVIRRFSDNIFAFCALRFLLCTCFMFVALQKQNLRNFSMFIGVIDGLFLGSPTLMTIGSFLLVYRII